MSAPRPDRERAGEGVPVVQLKSVTKRFGDVVACDAVDLMLRRGEIHGILGENGAGKSTLMRMIAGLVVPDRGSILIDGVAHTVRDPVDAAAQGIGMVHQDYSLVDALTVWENVALGESGPLDRDATRRRVAETGERYGLEVDPDRPVRDLSAGMRQRVEIVKCLSHGPRIVILDEPTSVLTPAESEHLFDVLERGVRSEGWAVALVGHQLDEVLRATDRITIMRDGSVVDRVQSAGADAPSLARAMVGRDLVRYTGEDFPRQGIDGPAVLQITDAHLRAPDGAVLLDGLSLSIRPGEVVGVAGVEGNGQTPLTQVLSSVSRLDGGTVEVGGVAVRTGRAGAMKDAGVAVVPADGRSGRVLSMTVAENLILSDLDSMAERGVLVPERIEARARRLIAEFDIRSPGPDTPLGQLSGGNQQRVVLARALSNDPKVLVAHQPTRGLDVGAAGYIRARLGSAASEGVGILLISTDLGEITSLADRVVVIRRGRIVGEVDRFEMDLERLGLLMTGGDA